MFNDATRASDLHSSKNKGLAEIYVMEPSPCRPRYGSLNSACNEFSDKLSVIGIPQEKLYCEKLESTLLQEKTNGFIYS